MRWRLILEELSLEPIYIKGSKTIVADALSHLNKLDNLNKSSTESKNNNNDNKVEPTLESLIENFALNKEGIFPPTSFKLIMTFQQKEIALC